nr:unnamed protein product [Spirometra erinaceieuropaei]
MFYDSENVSNITINATSRTFNTETATDDEETPDAQPPPLPTPTTNPTIKFATPASIISMITTTPASFNCKNTANAPPPTIVTITTTVPTTNNMGSIPTCPRCGRTLIACVGRVGHSRIHRT